MLAEARSIHEEDRAVCRAIGRPGATLLRDVTGVLTHCNAGGLATSEYGTALAAIYTAQCKANRSTCLSVNPVPCCKGLG